MKTFSKLSLVLALVCLLTVLASCSDSKLEGTYSGTYNYEGKEISVVITLGEDGTYTRESTIDGEKQPASSGDYELKDGKVFLYSADHRSGVTYQYVDGALKNDFGTFTK